jgi:hypothetical protein
MRRFIGFVVTLLLLLVVLDRVAWFAAERGVGQTIRTTQHLSSTPHVSIKGFPFLTQAIRGRYTEVDGTISDLTVQKGVTISALDVHLQGVHVPLGDLVKQQVTGAPVDDAYAVGTVSYPDLNAAAKTNSPSSDLTFTFGPTGSSDQVKVTGAYHGPLLSAKISGRARISVVGGRLVISPLADSLDGVPGVIRSQVVSLLGVSYELPALPFGFKAQKVTVGPDAVTVTVAAKDVVLTQTAS